MVNRPLRNTQRLTSNYPALHLRFSLLQVLVVAPQICKVAKNPAFSSPNLQLTRKHPQRFRQEWYRWVDLAVTFKRSIETKLTASIVKSEPLSFVT